MDHQQKPPLELWSGARSIPLEAAAHQRRRYCLGETAERDGSEVRSHVSGGHWTTAVILMFLWLPVKAQTTIIDDPKVIWDSLSTDSWGSMPIGIGDIGPNVWLPVSLPSHTSWFC